MSNNYPPQGGGQPPLPYGQGPNPNQANPYNQAPAQNYPPVAPTQPVYYAPPPGANPNSPYGAPQTGQPYPPAAYPGQAVRPKRKGGPAGIIVAVIVVLVIAGVAAAGVLGVFNTVEASDYPGATKATLTDKGTTYVNSLYDNKSSDRDNRKVFLTGDTPEQVFQFYKADLVKKGWTFEKDGQLDGIAGSQFSKSSDLILVLSGGPAEGFIKDEGTQNFIIVVTGKNV